MRALLTTTSQHKGSPSFFLSCFLSLFLFVCSETHIYSFFVFLLSRLFFYRIQKSDTLFISVVFRAPTTYTYLNISGVARDTCFSVFERETLQKMLGASPSVRVFGSRFSGARSVASRPRPDSSPVRVHRNIDIYR